MRAVPTVRVCAASVEMRVCVLKRFISYHSLFLCIDVITNQIDE